MPEFNHDEVCGQPARDQQLLAICNNPDTVFYGPHPCEVCGKAICKASREQGGMEFEYPEGIIYPNTNWVQHVHDERKVMPNVSADEQRRCEPLPSNSDIRGAASVQTRDKVSEIS